MLQIGGVGDKSRRREGGRENKNKDSENVIRRPVIIYLPKIACSTEKFI